jgi:cytoskeletal protein CcmA (bactofilin family)
MYYKNFFIITLSLLILLFNLAYAEDNLRRVMNGNAEIQETKLYSLVVNGKLNFRKLNVENKLEVNGPIKGNALEAKIIEVNGSMDVDDIKAMEATVNGRFIGNKVYIEKSLEVNGSFKSDNVENPGNLTINGNAEIRNGKINNIQFSGNIATFERSQINNILVKKEINTRI